MRRVYLFAVGAVLLLAAFVAAVEKKEPKVRLRSTPRISLAPIRGGVLITSVLIIEDADKEHWCPAVRFESNEEGGSGRESDCNPFSDMDPEDTEWQSWRDLRWLGRDEWEICAILSKSDKTIRKVCERVSVR